MTRVPTRFATLDFPRGTPLFTSNLKNQVVKARARLRDLHSWSDLIANLHWSKLYKSKSLPASFRMAEASGSWRRKAALTVDKMLTAEPRTKMTVRRSGQQDQAREAAGSTQVGTSGERFQSGHHMSCLVNWASKYAPEEEIADLFSKSDESFVNNIASVLYRSVLRLLTQERLRESAKKDAEVEALRSEVGILRDEVTFLRMEHSELRWHLDDERGRELQLQGVVSDLEA